MRRHEDHRTILRAPQLAASGFGGYGPGPTPSA